MEMTEELKEMARSNYAAQMAILGYETNGNPKDMVEVVRCADCVYFEPNNYEEGDSTGRCRNNNCPCQNQQTDMVWFCADGERKE